MVWSSEKRTFFSLLYTSFFNLKAGTIHECTKHLNHGFDHSLALRFSFHSCNVRATNDNSARRLGFDVMWNYSWKWWFGLKHYWLLLTIALIDLALAFVLFSKVHYLVLDLYLSSCVEITWTKKNKQKKLKATWIWFGVKQFSNFHSNVKFGLHFTIFNP